MKKVMSIMVVALLVAGSMAVYAGSGCGGCGGEKADEKEKSSENTEQASTTQKADTSA
jgi:formate dehydrogenase assembly factor FdhD